MMESRLKIRYYSSYSNICCMPPNPIQTLDRLSVRSVLRGSTSTICGVIGTLAVIILCIAIYAPVAQKYLKGDFYESQFMHMATVQSKLYSNRDFKIAIQFVNRVDNSVANHTDIQRWAFTQFYELLADYSATYYEPSIPCRADYFADTINPITLTDCFMFPEYSLLHMFKDWGLYTWYSNLFYWLTARDSIDPFTSLFAGSLGGNYRNFDNLLKNYYYVVYFTSKIVDSSSGKAAFQLNRFYSSQSAFNSAQGGAVDLLIYHQKQYNMDISIMPWSNNITEKGLVWLGKSQTIFQASPTQFAVYGIQIDWSFDKYHINSYRYYKKLDWLLGIIGGAMLLFYIILWVPCNYINRTRHKKDNVSYFMMLNHAGEDHRLSQNSVTAANVSGWYYLSNPFVNCVSSQARSASKLVMAGELELDIARLVKKMKVTERSLKKKDMWKQFKPKVFDMQTIVLQNPAEGNRRQQQRDQDELEEGGYRQQSVDSQNLIEEEVIEEQFVELPTDNTFGLTEAQMDAVKDEPRLKNVYENNMTGAILTQGEQDSTSRLLQMENKSRYKAKYETRRRKGRLSRLTAFIGQYIEYFDFFGVRPNLIVDPYGSSFVGLCGVILIILMSLLLVALTVRNANRPEFIIDHNYQEVADFQYSVVTGDTLNLAICFSYASQMRGSTRKADLRFFTESKSRGRVYFQPEQLSSASAANFEIPTSEVPVSLSYCFGFPANNEVLMAQDQDDSEYAYFGFRVEPYCSSTALYCSANAALINDNFLNIMNRTQTNLFLPENRFDTNSTTLINNMVNTPLNIDYRYMNNASALQETLFVDEVRIMDDTQNWFMRSGATVKERGISSNVNTLSPLSRSIPGNPYYQVKIRPSSHQVNYVITTKKADIILGIIGGIFVLMYAAFHWIGKLYNSFNIRAKLAEEVYYEESISQSPLNKFLTIVPVPTCLLPSCFHIKNDVMRMRQIQKKIQNDLNYVWLTRYVDTIFNLSSSLFDRIQAKNLSQVFVKEKIDQGEQVIGKIQRIDVQEDDFIGFDDEPIDDAKLVEKGRSKVINQTITPEPSLQKIDPMGGTSAFEKFKPSAKLIQAQNGATQKFTDNYMHGLPKQPRFNWLDTFEYPASLTLNGKREVTSCCGGCCCLILMIFIIIIGAFEVSVYLDKDDARVGMSTGMMEPLEHDSNSTFNSRIHLTTGSNFKLAVTFSSAYADYPHNVSNWTNSAVGISIFKQTYTRQLGQLFTQTMEVPLIPCPRHYITNWLSPLSDPAYYPNTQFGYCVPDGMVLEIDGLPQDSATKRFTLSIYNKLKTTAGDAELKSFMQIYLPKYHFSNPQLDAKKHQFDYFMTSITFDAFNVTYPTSQNISLQKVAVLYDDQLVLEGDPYMDIAYAFTQFQTRQTAFYDAYVGTSMSYNLSFANNYNVKYITFQNQKFPATFGIIGGLVAIFIFGFGCCARSFNTYRMHYLIGKQLYLFDMLKKKEARNKARGRLRKSREQRNELSDINNMSQFQLLKAYMLSLFASPLGFYNFNDTLRRVTILQQKVEEDINLFNVYKKMHLMRDIFNQHYGYTKVPICDIYLKKIYNPDPDTSSLVNLSKLIAFAKKNNWSCMEQFSVFEAFQAKVNLKSVFDNAFLEKELNMYNSDATSVHLSQFGGTQGTFGTNSMVSANMSEMHREEEEIIPDEA